MNLNNNCRKAIPYVEFKANHSVPLEGGVFDLASFCGRDYFRMQLDEHTANLLTDCFKKPTFEKIVDAVVDAVNSNDFGNESLSITDSSACDVYFFKSVGDKIHLRFYAVSEIDAKWFQDAVGSELEPDESLGHVWVLTPEQMNTWEMRDYFTWFCGVVVDLNTMSLWRIKE